MSLPAPFRFAVEAAVLIAIGVALAAADLTLLQFVLVMGAAWLLVATGERLVSRPGITLPSVRRQSPEPFEAPTPAEQERETTPETARPEPEPEPPLAEDAEPEPEPERVLEALPEPQPEPEPEPQQEDEEPEEQVVALPQAASRRPDGWNLWDLERRAQERAGQDPLRDEEWYALFVSLRDFASPDGTLPREFDDLVHESFGELISRRA